MPPANETFSSSGEPPAAGLGCGEGPSARSGHAASWLCRCPRKARPHAAVSVGWLFWQPPLGSTVGRAHCADTEGPHPRASETASLPARYRSLLGVRPHPRLGDFFFFLNPVPLPVPVTSVITAPTSLRGPPLHLNGTRVRQEGKASQMEEVEADGPERHRDGDRDPLSRWGGQEALSLACLSRPGFPASF